VVCHLDQLGSRHARHQVIGDHQVRLFAPQLRQAGFGVARGGHAVAQRFERLHHRMADQAIVLDHQDAGARALNIRFAGPVLDRGRGRGAGRAQPKFDSGSYAYRAVHPCGAAGLLRHAVDLAQPKTGSFPDLFGGEERLEHLGQDVGPDSHAAIDHGNPHVLARRKQFGRRAGPVRPDDELAPGRHGVARVDGEVDQRHLHLVQVCRDEPGLLLDLDPEPDSRAERCGQQGLYPFE
jgi:hypothetical protein